MTSASRRDRWRLRAGISFTRVRPRLRGASKEGEMSHEYSNPKGPWGDREKRMAGFAGEGADSGGGGAIPEPSLIVGKVAFEAEHQPYRRLTPEEIKSLEDKGGGAVKADTGKLRVDLF